MLPDYLLRHLIAIDQYHSLSAAAKALFLTQPTLSHSVKELEKHFGIPLFHKAGNHIEPNEAGKYAAELAREIVTVSDQLIDKVLEFNQQIRHLSLGSCAYWPVKDLAETLAAHYQETEILSEISSDESLLLRKLLAKEYDIIILSYLPESDSLNSSLYLNDFLLLSVSSESSMATAPSLSFNDINGSTFLIHQECGIWETLLRQNLTESEFIPLQNNEILSKLVDGSDFLAFSSQLRDRLQKKNDKRIHIPISDTSAQHQYYLVWRQDINKHLQEFLNNFESQET